MSFVLHGGSDAVLYMWYAVARTLRDVDVTAREAIEGGKSSIHVNTMLPTQLAVVPLLPI